MLLKDVLEEFIYDCQLRKLSMRTIKSFRNNNLRFISFLEENHSITELEDVKRIHIQSYITYLSELKRKETYINSIIKTLRAFFVYCVNESYVEKSVMDKIKFQRESKTLILTFTDDEVKKMVNHYSGITFMLIRNKMVMTLLFDSGIRNYELCNIEMQDINHNALKIHGKGNKIRYIPVTPSINKMLIRYLIVREHYIKDKFNYDKKIFVVISKWQTINTRSSRTYCENLWFTLWSKGRNQM